ncbi:MAG: LysM peptidoglycan-binding domain-containing protein [Patescibacteria group bacterium]|nr:LysM peptidoglycan-binding domain-containing protein [Patescibacteria group bacterium]
MSHQKRGIIPKKQIKNVRKKIHKYGLVTVNAAIIVAVTGFVWVGQNSASTSANNFSLASNNNDNSQPAPLDKLSSADIAANIALTSGLPQEIMVVNQADSYKTQLTQAAIEESVVSKPQVVTGGSQSKYEITTYAAKEGDTVPIVAESYGVSADTIKWSNGLTNDDLPVGKKIKIPPANGIVYTVKPGDTPTTLANAYQSSSEAIIAFNDAENGLKEGDTILIPDGKPPTPAPSSSRRTSTRSTTTTTYSNYVPQYGGNGYARGYCTWYAASRVPVPSNWGNANTWDNRARVSGWTVSSVPVVGAVAQRDGGYGGLGHVAIVEAVSEDKTMIIYSDMNGLAGYGRVGTSGWVSASSYSSYIYR